MAGVGLWLHLPDVAVADEDVVHGHSGIWRLALGEKTHLGFARIAVEFCTDHLNVEVCQTKVPSSLQVAQDGGPDGFIGIDTGFLAPGQQAQQQGSQEDE